MHLISLIGGLPTKGGHCFLRLHLSPRPDTVRARAHSAVAFESAGQLIKLLPRSRRSIGSVFLFAYQYTSRASADLCSVMTDLITLNFQVSKYPGTVDCQDYGRLPRLAPGPLIPRTRDSPPSTSPDAPQGTFPSLSTVLKIRMSTTGSNPPSRSSVYCRCGLSVTAITSVVVACVERQLPNRSPRRSGPYCHHNPSHAERLCRTWPTPGQRPLTARGHSTDASRNQVGAANITGAT